MGVNSFRGEDQGSEAAVHKQDTVREVLLAYSRMLPLCTGTVESVRVEGEDTGNADDDEDWPQVADPRSLYRAPTRSHIHSLSILSSLSSLTSL